MRRTRELDDLGTTSRTAGAAVEKVRAEQLDLEQRLATAQRSRSALDDEARGPFESAVRQMELRVFLIRLAITLPPLAIAAWLFVRKRKTSAWPFVRGFIFFAAFTFFVELVPYLPSYGGYVRYLIGMVITIAIGRYSIVAMQRYMHCGMKLFEGCPACSSRRNAFFHYCPTCGVDKPGGPVPRDAMTAAPI